MFDHYCLFYLMSKEDHFVCVVYSGGGEIGLIFVICFLFI